MNEKLVHLSGVISDKPRKLKSSIHEGGEELGTILVLRSCNRESKSSYHVVLVEDQLQQPEKLTLNHHINVIGDQHEITFGGIQSNYVKAYLVNSKESI